MDANKSIEQRIEELESLVYESKNVLSFDEASKFLSLSTSEPGQDPSTDCQ